jgi:hypothetical protein
MPYAIRKLKDDAYRVYNKTTGKIYAKHTTLENAKKQLSLLNGLEEDPKKAELEIAIKNQNTLVKANTTIKKKVERLKKVKEELKSLMTDLRLGNGLILGEDDKVKLPYETEYNLQVPPFAIATNNKKSGYNYKLVNPITKIRNLAKRKGQFVIGVDRRAIPIPELSQREGGENKPNIKDFSPADRALIKGYDELIDKYEDEFIAKDFENIPEIPFTNSERGRPCKLPKNCKKGIVKGKQGRKDVKAPAREPKKKEEDEEEDLFANLVADDEGLTQAERNAAKAEEKAAEKEVEKAGVRKRPALEPKEPPTERFKPKGRKEPKDFFEKMRDEGDEQDDYRKTIQVSAKLLFERVIENKRPLRADDPIFVKLAKQARKEKLTENDIQRRFCPTTYNQYYSNISSRNYGESYSNLVSNTPALGVYGTWKEPWAMRMNYNKLANENEIKGSPIRLLFPPTSNMRLSWGNIGYGDSDEIWRFLVAMLDYEFGVRLLYAMNGRIKTDAERAKEAEERSKRKASRRGRFARTEEEEEDDQNAQLEDINMRILSWNEEDKPSFHTEGSFFRWAVNDFHQQFKRSIGYIGYRAYLPYELSLYERYKGQPEAEQIQEYTDTWEEDHWEGWYANELDKEEIEKLEPTKENVEKEYNPWDLTTANRAFYYMKNTFGLELKPEQVKQLRPMLYYDGNAENRYNRGDKEDNNSNKKLLTNILRWLGEYDFAGRDDFRRRPSEKRTGRFRYMSWFEPLGYEGMRRKPKKGRGLDETEENNISPNIKMSNPWISYCKQYAKDNNMSYRDVIKSADAKEGYKSGGASVVQKGTAAQFRNHFTEKADYKIRGNPINSGYNKLMSFIIHSGDPSTSVKDAKGRVVAMPYADTTNSFDPAVEVVLDRVKKRPEITGDILKGTGMKIGGGFINYTYLPASSNSQSQIANAYNDSELGPNGGKRYVSL